MFQVDLVSLGMVAKVLTWLTRELCAGLHPESRRPESHESQTS